MRLEAADPGFGPLGQPVIVGHQAAARQESAHGLTPLRRVTRIDRAEKERLRVAGYGLRLEYWA